MRLAATEAASTTVNFYMFDIFMLLFTVVIAIGLFRLLKSDRRNLFALGFTSICLLVFLATDALMIMNWLGKL